MEKIILASSNKGKIAEFKEILGDKFEILSLKEVGFFDEIEENGSTFEENALIKANAIFEKFGEYVIADDSGLVCPSLGGEPGVYSARYAGNHDTKANNKLLIKNLQGKDRNAYFECALVLLGKGVDIRVSGRTHGIILDKECGDKGFGYDPLFFSNDLQKCFGLCSSEEKNNVSHRGRAIKSLIFKMKEKGII